jgi:uncharacterized protein YjiS (DUF1127 family)
MSVVVSHSPWFTARGTLAVRLFSRIGQRAVNAVRTWRARVRQRSELLMLNDVELRELSLIEADVNRETNKPFWESISLKG